MGDVGKQKEKGRKEEGNRKHRDRKGEWKSENTEEGREERWKGEREMRELEVAITATQRRPIYAQRWNYLSLSPSLVVSCPTPSPPTPSPSLSLPPFPSEASPNPRILCIPHLFSPGNMIITHYTALPCQQHIHINPEKKTYIQLIRKKCKNTKSVFKGQVQSRNGKIYHM